VTRPREIPAREFFATEGEVGEPPGAPYFTFSVIFIPGAWIVHTIV
jgi:hypothetical protein